MSPPDHIIIVGAGLAGYGVIRELRKLDAEVPLTLITNDDGSFYSKPRLSNHLSSGRGMEALVSSSGEEMAQKNNFKLLNYNHVESINTEKQTLTATHGQHKYGKLVLALGAQPRQPSYGFDSKKVISINHLLDYMLFAPQLETKKSVAIYGGGLVACEFANDLAIAGHDVTLVTRTSSLLDRMLSPQSSDRLVKALQNVGVRMCLNNDITKVEDHGDGLSVHLQQGSILKVNYVLNAIGLVPHRLGKDCGLKTDRGIVVDEYLETSQKNIYALGDGAQYPDGWLPFVMPITHAAKALAQNLLGERRPVTFPPMPVAVKTASFPLVIGTSKAEDLSHTFEANETGCAETWRDAEGKLRAFVLGGSRCADKATYMKEWSP